METLFSHLFSSQEPQRSQAYSLLHCCRKHFPDLVFIKLFYVIRQGPSADIRARSALVLRFVLCDLWPRLSLNAQINMKNNFLVSLQEEGSLPTLRILCAIAGIRDFWGRNWFHDLLRGMMVGLFNLLSHLKEDYARGALKELIMLVMEEPRLLKPYLNELVLDVLKIADSEHVTEGTKVFVHKFLLTVAEASDLALTMRGLPHQTLVRLLTVPMKLLLCACYNKESDQGANVGKTDLGIAYLTKISTALGEKTMTPIAFELFLEYMDASNWKKRHTGISMLAVIAKECSGEMVIALPSFALT
ncbi:unnamed protein product [Prunus armeniaca]|uniref:Uncharacterized protein n=1 Tax=Prunus armeniaca TaxID=36596 RepID=A0A6J5TBX1_PRUAR|nr:unnamed protein product [Prunus armeniaca]